MIHLCVLAVATLAGLPLGAEPTRNEPEQKVFAEPKPDQALVYVIRPHGPGLGDKVGSYIYADQTVLAHLKGNTYSFAYLPPGSYLVWDYLARRLDLVPGQVYYVLCGPFHGGISLLGEEEGKQLLQTVKRYRPLDPEHAAEGQEKAAKLFPKVKANVEKHKRGAEVAAVPVPSPPADTEGLVRVPAYSPVQVELMETVSSRLSSAGETIWFRVAEDASIEGKVWLRAGTPVKAIVVEAGHSGGGGKAGSLEVRVPALPAAGGAAVPAVGQMVSVGKSKAQQATLGFAVGGLLGSALVKGRETYQLAGSQFTVWTRDEAWAEPAGEPTSAPPPPETPAPVTVKPVQPLRFAPGTREAPGPVALLVETDREIKQLALMEVGDWTIPDPPKSIRLERREGQWMATFQGWDLLQHLRPSSTPIPMRFEATPAEGAPFIAEASVSWTPEP